MNEELLALMQGDFPPLGENEKAMMDHFVVQYAREISTDGGKTAKINGAVIVLEQPIAYKKHKEK
jgi:hypothetical protein